MQPQLLATHTDYTMQHDTNDAAHLLANCTDFTMQHNTNNAANSQAIHCAGTPPGHAQARSQHHRVH